MGSAKEQEKKMGRVVKLIGKLEVNDKGKMARVYEGTLVIWRKMVTWRVEFGLHRRRGVGIRRMGMRERGK